MRRLHLLTVCVSSLALAIAGVATGAGADSAPGLGDPPGDVQSWLLTLHLSGHVFYVGDTIVATATVAPIGKCGPGRRCVSGITWQAAAGMEAKHACGPKTWVCVFKATEETDGWQQARVEITNDVGPAFSADYYTIIDKTKRVISGTATHPANGRGIPGVQISIMGGKRPVVARTGSAGFYSAILKKGAYTVSYFPASKYESYSHNGVRATLGKQATVNFVLKEKHRYLLSGVDENGKPQPGSVKLSAGGGHQATYVGSDWDELGSQIAVDAAGQAQPAVNATSGEWRGSLALNAYPEDTCRLNLSASQDGTTRQLAFWTRRVARVLLAAGTPSDTGVQNGRRTPTGSYLCEGEQIENVNTSAAVYQAIVHDTFQHLVHNGAGFNGLRIIDNPGQVFVSGELYAPSVRLPTGSGMRTVAGNGGGNIASFDTAGRSGLQQIPGAFSQNTTFGGFLRVAGDFHSTAQVALDGAVLYVNGNVTIDGGLQGTGALIATGRVTIHGPVHLTSDGATSIRAGGPVVFSGP